MESRRPNSPIHFIWRQILFSLIVVAGRSLFAQPSTNLQRATDCFERQDWACAEANYKHELQRFPRNSSVHYNSALALLKQGKYKAAESHLETVVLLDPNDSEAYAALGLSRFKLDKLESAAAAYLKSIDINPTAEAYSDVGLIFVNQGQFKRAIPALQQALKIQPELPEAHTNLGLARLMQGNPSAAIAELRTATKLDPNSVEAQTTLSLALSEKGQYKEAIAILSKVTQREPDFAEAYAGLGMVLVQQGNFSEGMDSLRKSITIDPLSARCHLLLGLGLYGQGNTQEGMAHIKKAKDLFKEQGRPRFAAQIDQILQQLNAQ